MVGLKCCIENFVNSAFHTGTKSFLFIITTMLCAFSTPEQDTLVSWIKSDAHQEFVMIELRGPQDQITKVIGNKDCKPYNLVWPDAFKSNCEKLLKDQQIFLSCASGNRAGQAKTYLTSLGYQHVINVGGFSSWQSAYPDLTIDYKDTLPIADLPKSSKRTPSRINNKVLNVQKVNADNEVKIVLTSGSPIYRDYNCVHLLTGQVVKGTGLTKSNSGVVYIFRRK
jgi:rhodanese-related sulfurtransferase